MKRFWCLIMYTMLFFCSCNTNTENRKETNNDIIIITSGEQKTAQMFAMDTFMQITVYDSNISERQLYEIMETIRHLEHIFSATDEESELFALNNAKSGDITNVSEELKNVLCFAVDISEKTNGYFDVTAYPLIRAWGFTQEEYRIPSGDELSKLLTTVNYRNIKIFNESISLLDGSKIDLGALVKGYTGDILVKKLKDIGVEKAVLSLGGNIVVIGEKNNQEGWKVGVCNPIQTSENIGYLEISDSNVITSGGYERYFEGDDGEIYWHIINPKTGYPAKAGLVSVTVVGENGMMCDALSTALFIMGEEKAIDFYQENEAFEFILVADDGAIIITEGIANDFTLYDKSREFVIVSK